MKVLMTLKDWESHPSDPMKFIYEDDGGKKYIGPRMNCMIGDIMSFEVSPETGKEAYHSFRKVIFHTSDRQK
jgi:hypothetical protein